MSKLTVPKRKSKETTRFVLEGVYLGSDESAVLIGKHAGRSNAAYTSGLLKVLQDSPGGRPTIARLAENDAKHIRLFAKYVITGWENVFDGKVDGKGVPVPVPFSPEDLEDLLTQLCAPDQYPEIVGANGAMDRHFSDADNFRADPIGSPAALGKG